MIKTQVQSYTSAAADADGLADDVAYSGGGYALTSSGPGDSLAHPITILGNAATNHSGKTFTITGTDVNGVAQTDAIAGPNGNVTVTSTKYFKTVTSVTVSATTDADTFDIGWTAPAVGPALLMDLARTSMPNIGIFCRVPSGTPNYTLQYSSDLASSAEDDATIAGTSWLDHATIAAKTATFGGVITSPVVRLRLKFAAAGPVAMTVLETNDRF